MMPVTRAYRWFDFGEVVENDEGLAQFKSKWGAEPQRLFRYYYSAALESQSELDTRSGHAFKRNDSHSNMEATAAGRDRSYW